MNQLKLYFLLRNDRPELVESHFIHANFGIERRSVRGKTAGVYPGYGSFQWTRAVSALCVLILKGLLSHIDPEGQESPILIGGKGSLACSLDYALSKEPLWFFDMFGSERSGRALIRRYIKVTNSNRHLPGPVALRITSTFLVDTEIKLFLDSIEIKAQSSLRSLLHSIEHTEMSNRNTSRAKQCETASCLHGPILGEDRAMVLP